MAVLLAAPLLLVDIPPLLDYPNHLARAMVLASGGKDPFLSRMYAQHWDIIPNLALDIVLPALSRIVPLDVAGRLVLALALLLPVAGCVAYSRAVFGRPSYWPLASGLMAYNALFLLGFANFLIGLGLGLLFAAAWIRGRDHHPAAVATASLLCTTALFFVHIFGLMFMFALVGGEEVVALLASRPDRSRLGRSLMRAVVAAPAIVFPAVLYLLAPLHETGGDLWWRPIQFKYLEFFEPLLTYFSRWDLALGPVVLAALYIVMRKGLLCARPAAVATYGLLFVIYLALPFRMKSTSFIDARVPVMLGLVLCSGLIGARQGAGVRPVTVAALAAVLLVRQVGIASVWLDHRQDLTALRTVMAPVRPGSRVVVVSVQPNGNPSYWDHVPRGRIIPMFARLDFHLAALLLIEHRAFWPLLFTMPGKQPLQVLPPYSEDAIGEGIPPDYRLLQTRGRPEQDEYAPYLENWAERFDYVLLLNAGGAGQLDSWMSDRLRLLAATDVAALFEVRSSTDGRGGISR